MRTSLPFLDLAPEQFIKRRFAPLIVTVEDADVVSFMSKCGFTFTDFLAALGNGIPFPLRFTKNIICQSSYKNFERDLVGDMREYSKMFLPEDFEMYGKIERGNSQFAQLIPEKLDYQGASAGSAFWWKTFLFRIFESVLYSDFDFCDFPVCIFYITTVDSKHLTPTEVKSRVTVPEWMKEFIAEIPVVCVLVNDSLLRTPTTDDIKCVTGFTKVVSVSIRTKSDAKLSEDRLKELFGLDPEIMKDPNLGNFISRDDVMSVVSLLKSLSVFVKDLLNEKEKALGADVIKYTGFRYRFLRGGQESQTEYMNVSIRKITFLRHAYVSMALGKYADAQKSFKLFISQLEANELDDVRVRSSFYSALCQLILPNSFLKDFASHIQETLKIIGLNSPTKRCHCSAIMVPLYAMEVHAARGDLAGASKVCRYTISSICKVWPVSTRYVVCGLINERMAGFNNKNKHVLLYLIRAGMYYREAKLNGHELRTLNWVMKMLPEDKWVMLKQQAWLEKVRTLQALEFDERSLYCCRDLLCLPDLCPFLQERVLSRFWYPFNSSHFDAENVKLELRNLIEVKNVTLVDSGMPEFYGYSSDDFHSLVKSYTKWFKAHVSRSLSISFEEIWQTDRRDSIDNGRVVTTACGTPVRIAVELVNQFMFAVRLDETNLRVKYEGDEDGTFDIVGDQGLDIPGQSTKGVVARYEITPHSQGTFTVTDFEKNYWGYVKTSMECGPVSFHAVRDYPMMTIEITNLPEIVYEDSCIEFSIRITNIGTKRVDSFRLVMDNPSIIEFTGPELKRTTKKMLVIDCSEGLEPGDVKTVPLIFKALCSGSIKMRMFVDVNRNKICYLMKAIRTVPAVTVKTDVFMKLNDTGDKIIKCHVQSLVDGISINGLVNQQGKLLRTLSPVKEITLNTDEAIHLIAFISEPESISLEPWRKFDQSGLTLLYRVGDNKLMSQKLIDVKTDANRRNFKFTIPPTISGDRGTQVECEVSMSGSQTPVYIEPMPVGLVDKSKRMNGCRWAGKTRIKLCEENHYTAKFTLMAITSGIYQISGFRISEKADFLDVEAVQFSQRICVTVN